MSFYFILANKCSGSCYDINDPYAKLCVPDVVKDMNIKAFNLVSMDNERVMCTGMRIVRVNED